LVIGLHDTFWRDDPSAARRFAVAALAGLVEAVLLILISMGGGFSPAVSPGLYIPVFLATALLVGGSLSLVVPLLGTTRSLRSQLAHAALATVMMAVVSALCVWIVYGRITDSALIVYLMNAVLLPLGIALALV
jgi:hypothetical protein